VFFPLELFDDTSFETKTLEQLSKPGQRAVSKWFLTEGSWEWRPCTVLGYDEKREQFLIEWDGNKTRKHVSRLNLRFDDENKQQFALRLQAAHELRLACEARVSRNMRIDLLDYSDVHEPPPSHYIEIVSRIGPRTMQKIEHGVFPQISTPQYLENEICLFFKKSNKVREYWRIYSYYVRQSNMKQSIL
jgi:hypothetical protein